MTADPEPSAFPFPNADPLSVPRALGRARTAGAPIRVRPPYGRPAWLVTDHEDARTVLASPDFGRDAARAGIPDDDVPRITPVDPISGSILAMDPPDHTRVRRLIGRVFTPRRVEGLRPRAQGIADRLADDLIADGPPADLLDRFALPIPLEVICELLGVPHQDRARFAAWSDAFLSTSGLTVEDALHSLSLLNGYLSGLIAQRTAHPTDDLIGALTQVHDEGGPVTAEEVLGLVRGLLVGGYETSSLQIANFVLLLLRGDGYTRLAADASLIPNAVEELLRYVPLSPLGSLPRYALTDVEVGGVLIRAGESVLVELSAANRDPGVFDDPEVLDLERPAAGHLGFGHGIHHCVGAALARMELQVAVGTLTRRFPHLALTVAEEAIEWRENFIRGPQRLPVTW
ncbi:cytochrome P450 [Nocardiopsis sediminis]|uniref:Cytochrome P450 n=1 Tax=Nocardiopsis sediminis TaxID=1778267 RepID=A0ABV8FH91_9ACTN